MNKAIILAKKAENEGEIPVGAILVLNKKLIATGWNQCIKLKDPTAHAEIIALRKGGNFLQNYRLINTKIYVTLEPSLMCIGAIIHARIKHIIYGATKEKKSMLSFLLSQNNYNIKITKNILNKECSIQLKKFFINKRN